ncbi:Histidinol-phosphatase [Phycisphaerae bacterium RAS1]|nr:Histidinol-phosphatase [Phycisphaerae bacterium RAS1]
MDAKQLQDVLDFAVESAQLAGAYTLGYFNAAPPTEIKSDDSPVTVADRGAEERLRARIEAAFPGHGILGEEFGEKSGVDPARWILDPIDGTQSFISGVPLYSVLVGLEWRGEMVLGVIHLPALHETIYAARGLGCWCNGRRAWTSEVAELSQARFAYTGVRGMRAHGRVEAFERLIAACRIDRGWSDAYAYALLATGRVEVVADPKMAIWDCAALLPIVREAGGTFTDWNGKTTHTGGDAIATNGPLFEQVMHVVQGGEPPR